jgi:predicted DNA-binding transcriptional regulator AlpA
MPRNISLLSDQDDVRLLRKAQVARRLGVSVWTIDRLCKTGKFPKPIYLIPGSPDRWRVQGVDAFVEKQRSARRVKPKSRGKLVRTVRENTDVLT